MRGLPHTWDVPGLDPAEQEARAQAQHDMAVALVQSGVWEQMRDALTSQVTDTLNDLARSQKDDEQNRGVIRALNHVLSMPENLIRAASAELDKHR